MLDPSERNVLFEAMKPPPEHQLDAAVGTTFTLDLLTLLATPLAFTSYGWLDDESKTDAIEILESVRRFVDKVTVFCQAGYIRAPKARQSLLGFLHDAVVEVTAPTPGGIFHPKVWALRFTGPEQAVRYRLLVLSRNHTFDQSWDTILTLDGELVNRKKGISENLPLADFFRSLPGLALRPVSDRVRDQVGSVADELRRVRWELPEGVESIRFWPMGLDGYRTLPFDQGGQIVRLAVVSPFLTDGALRRLGELAPVAALVSRPESLVELPKETLGLAEQALYMPRDIVEDDQDETPDARPGEPPPRGLHAKLYVADSGRKDARVWTGSANATEAAFERNVELLLELSGRKSMLGIDAILGTGEDGSMTIRELLAPFDANAPDVESDAEARAAERLADELRRQLAELVRRGRVEVAYEAHYRLTVELEQPLPAYDARVRAWPVTLGEAHACRLEPGVTEAVFAVSREALTPFLAIEIELPDAPIPPVRFVLNVPLEGAPADYRDMLLRAALASPEQVMRYLMFLLDEGGLDVQRLLRSRGEPGDPSGNGAGAEIPLAEVLIRALERAPQQLDHIYSLVKTFETTPEGRARLPEGFFLLWPAIWEARQRLR